MLMIGKTSAHDRENMSAGNGKPLRAGAVNATHRTGLWRGGSRTEINFNQNNHHMTLQEFKEYVKTGRALSSEDIHRFMDEMSDAARRVTFRLNAAYHDPDEVRALLSELFGYEVPRSLRVFPPFYTDFGRNITVGEHVFINACCHFQDHGGVVLGDGCQIGHNVVFATLNHGLSPDDRQHTYPAPIVLGKNVWVGSNATILPGVTIGDNAVVAAGAVVTKDVAANTVVGGVPAKAIKEITAA